MLMSSRYTQYFGEIRSQVHEKLSNHNCILAASIPYYNRTASGIRKIKFINRFVDVMVDKIVKLRIMLKRLIVPSFKIYLNDPP